MKKYLIWGGVGIVVLIAAYLLFIRRKAGDNEKTAAGMSPQELEAAANSFFGQVQPLNIETEATTTDGKPKTLISKAVFENKVRAIIKQIANEPSKEWLNGIIRQTSEHWSNVAGLDLPQAVHVRARDFVALHYYYNE